MSEDEKKGTKGVTAKDQKMADDLKVDDNLASGPVRNRRCTDILCCLIFLVAMVGFCAAAYYGFQQGNPRNLFIGWDSDKNGCGYTALVKDKPYLYWVEPPSTQMLEELKTNPNLESFYNLLNKAVCVPECPRADDKPIDCHKPNWMLNAPDGKYKDCMAKDQLGRWFRYNTTLIGNSFCMIDAAGYASNTNMTQIKAAFQNNLYGKTAGRWMMNIIMAWQVLAVSLVTAVVFGYIYLFVIRLIGGFIIWVSFIVILALLSGGGAWTYFIKRQEYLPETNQTYQYLTYGSYTLWGLAGVMLILLLCCCQAIKIGIAVFQTTSQFIQSNVQVFLLPFIGFILASIWAIVWFCGTIFTFSTGTPAPRDFPYAFTTEIKWSEMTRYVFFFQVFMLFWINAFIVGCSEFIVGCSAVLWYFECKLDSKGRGTTWTSMKWLLKYHIGSIAFGSFIIAVCQMIRFLFEWYRKKIQKAVPGKLTKILLAATSYILWLMDKCVKYMTKNAYIQIACTCNDFCVSAWFAFALIIKNAHRFGAANSIGAIFNVVGIACIVIVNAGCAYLFMMNYPNVVAVDDPIPPTVIVSIFSGVIGALFLSIFSYSSDAILQAYLLDEQLRFAGPSRPDAMEQFAETLSKGKGGGGGCC